MTAWKLMKRVERRRGAASLGEVRSDAEVLGEAARASPGHMAGLMRHMRLCRRPVTLARQEQQNTVAESPARQAQNDMVLVRLAEIPSRRATLMVVSICLL